MRWKMSGCASGDALLFLAPDAHPLSHSHSRLPNHDLSDPFTAWGSGRGLPTGVRPASSSFPRRGLEEGKEMPFIPLFAGLGTGVGEWFLFALFIYAAVAMMRRPRRRRHWQFYESEPVPRLAPPPPDPGDDARAIRRSLPQVSAMTSGRLPVAYQAKVDEILRRTDGLLKYADRFPIGSSGSRPGKAGMLRADHRFHFPAERARISSEHTST